MTAQADEYFMAELSLMTNGSLVELFLHHLPKKPASICRNACFEVPPFPGWPVLTLNLLGGDSWGENNSGEGEERAWLLAAILSQLCPDKYVAK